MGPPAADVGSRRAATPRQCTCLWPTAPAAAERTSRAPSIRPATTSTSECCARVRSSICADMLTDAKIAAAAPSIRVAIAATAISSMTAAGTIRRPPTCHRVHSRLNQFLAHPLRHALSLSQYAAIKPSLYLSLVESKVALIPVFKLMVKWPGHRLCLSQHLFSVYFQAGKFWRRRVLTRWSPR